MTQILLAEDDAFLLDVMRLMLEGEGYEVFPAVNGKKALDVFGDAKPDLVISDVMMPEMDGFSLLEAIRARPDGAIVPFLFLSARTERTDVSRARSLGADDYLFKPFDARELVEAVRTRLDRRRVVELFDTRAAHLQTVVMLANVIEARDPYTAGHVERVRQLAVKLAMALAWKTEEIAILEFGAILHDIGKISVPSRVLKKTGSLNSDEWNVIYQHPQAGAKMLEGVTHLRAAIPYVLYHHEWWNGGGYPYGLKSTAIPREGRLLAIVDAFDAMTSDRPYRASMVTEEAVREIQRMSGSYFDPEMARIFLRLYG